ncbi:non-histone chromosomal protein 6 [Ceraceosorus bombacis]|nr:non-histone chromosomal protein 6 [Ceraceosorus bombacis]
MFMSQDWRERIKAANPDASFGEVGRLLGAKWQEMSEAQKKPYLDMAERDKVRAANEKAAFEKKSGGGKGSKKQQAYEEDSD